MGGMDNMVPNVAPPTELMRFQPLLIGLAVAYLAVIIVTLVVGNAANVLNDVFVAIAALFMAFRAQQCLGSCVLPFFLFAMMAAFLDIITVVSDLAQSYPGAGKFFASACPTPVQIILLNGTVVYSTKGDIPSTIMPDTEVTFTQDVCDVQYVLGNVAVLVSVLLDIIATTLGYRMAKIAARTAGVGQGLVGGTGVAPAGGGGQDPAPAPGFTPFGGPGQVLQG